MTIATVKVAYVNPPKPGRKQGSIKTEDGIYIGVWPEKLERFSPGCSYEIEYSTTDKGYHNLERILGPNGQAEPARRILATSLPHAKPGGGGDTKSVEMAVMGIVGRAYQGSGTVPDEHTLFEHMFAVRSAWLRAFATTPGAASTFVPPGNTELDDEIPF